ncbi:hypothetical protein MTQ13_26345 [Streptomyces sp. XM4011]|uniref:hypothetical protein n=1 Tax=Streptomyces sp. XM4011 TaxID=2929780 RepID=UPI001FF997C7|nr:hypothetical protein [Streptomyces sp. XM4011]MCK1817754.1 hypothetical protein [Streptomyces sp. XM4011]
MTTTDTWVRAYALLALRIDRRLTGTATGTVLIYRGPQEWRQTVAAEEPRPAGQLVEDAEAVVAGAPDRYAAAEARALRMAARRLAGENLPPGEYARAALGIEAGWLPEEVFEEAHARLDAALPPAPGRSLAERLAGWQAAHVLPADRVDAQVPDLVARAVAETRRRTAAIVPLPRNENVGCRLVSGVGFRAAGAYTGGAESVIHINRDLPFNLADLLYVVAHEGHPGHIAESLLKDRLGGTQHARFLLAPPFVVSEGLGLHAQEIAFPDDEAQRWLTDRVLAPRGIRPDGSDFAAVHRAQNALFGVWANAAFLAAEGRPAAEVAGYLARWALLSPAEADAARGSLAATGMVLYVLGYFHGWRLLDSWLAVPEAERRHRVRRLLTERLLPEDLR